ncbi:MAG: hypothetical protein KDD94_14990, partial [Calditrichaeota bacterium]|nr:hypothetical protein [Calditrichota bacterium]
MSDLTLFSTPKAFTGHIGMIQENAIQSWKNISDQVEIILLGDDVGVKEISHKYNLIHIPKIKKTKLGTPLIDSIFYAAQKKSTS